MEGEELKLKPKINKPKDPTESLVYHQIIEHNKKRKEFLRLKSLEEGLSAREEAESKARHRANDDIISFFEAEIAAGRELSQEEKKELKVRQGSVK